MIYLKKVDLLLKKFMLMTYDFFVTYGCVNDPNTEKML